MAYPQQARPADVGCDDFIRPVTAIDENGNESPVYNRVRDANNRVPLGVGLVAFGATALASAGVYYLLRRSRTSRAGNCWQRLPANMSQLPAAVNRKANRVELYDRPIAQSTVSRRVAKRPQALIRRLARRPFEVFLHLVPTIISLVVPLLVTRRRVSQHLQDNNHFVTVTSPPSRTASYVTPRDELRLARRESNSQTKRSHATWWNLLTEVFVNWSADKVPKLGAALAYYAVFSLAPLLVISLAVASSVFGEEAAQLRLHGQLEEFLGSQGAEAVESLLAAAHKPESGMVATILGLLALVFGASGVFGELQDSLNTIWRVQPKPGRGVWNIVRTRILSFGMVLAIAFLLLVSLVVSAALAALTSTVGDLIPGPDSLVWILNFTISMGTVTILFALIFKFLPDVEVGWRDVWPGAVVTAALFGIGKYLIGLYLGQASIGSAYGAAGSVVIVLLWTYYSAQIMFLGAEFTHALARRRGSPIKPRKDAVMMPGAN